MVRELYIFDFDDTLVSSGSNIRILNVKGNIVRTMTSEEFADPSHPLQITQAEKKKGFSEDFREFDVYPPDGITLPAFNIFQKALGTAQNGDVVVLSARREASPMADFLADNGGDGAIMMPVNGTAPSLKSSYVEKRLSEADPPFTKVYVYEDSAKNLSAIENLITTKFPEVEFNGHLVAKQHEHILRKVIRLLIESI